MLHIFQYDQVNDKLELNRPEILLIKEFAVLMDNKRNICPEDKTGKEHLRAYKEFTYIYLALDWQSFYSDYSEQERHQAALKDSGLTEEQFNNPEFRAACRKYRSLQESVLSIKLLRSSQEMVNKFVDYFHNVDPQERDETTGKPMWKVKDIQAELTNLPKVIDELKQVEGYVKKEMAEDSKLRGGATVGFTPTGQ